MDLLILLITLLTMTLSILLLRLSIQLNPFSTIAFNIPNNTMKFKLLHMKMYISVYI